MRRINLNSNNSCSSHSSSFRDATLQDVLPSQIISNEENGGNSSNDPVEFISINSTPPTALCLNYAQDNVNRNQVGLFSFIDADVPGGRVVSDRSTTIHCSDRKYKRMMNNRQSAARSRARKQAYTTQLEMEVAKLVDENEKLRNQCDELRSKVADRISKEKKLQRTLTAPF